MTCPHCLVDFHPARTAVALGDDVDGQWSAGRIPCPSCGRATIELVCVSIGRRKAFMVHPKGVARSPLSADVPDKYADDYREACLVLADSPKASAALSRRCLQVLIREHVGITKADLSKEIDAVLEQQLLPSHLSGAVDAIRTIGNFAAHPVKSKNTGEIVEVELGEAEWLLNTLEGLFDFYFVAPAVLQRKRDALNAKLAGAGKPKLK